MPVVRFKGGEINYEIEGKGNVVVFLHGFLQSLEVWKEFTSALKTDFRILLIDLPGHGRSSNFGYCHSMDLMSEAVMTVIRFLKIRRFYLVGHSMGGYVSIAISEKYPDNIRGLCMFHSTAAADPPNKKKERDKLIRLVEKSKDLFIKEAIPNLFNTKFKPYKMQIKQFEKMALGTTIQGIIASLEGMKIRESRELILKFAPYPVLYIIGKHDNVLPFQKLMDEASESEMTASILLENSGHMGFIEDAEASLSAIKKFLKN